MAETFYKLNTDLYPQQHIWKTKLKTTYTSVSKYTSQTIFVGSFFYQS